MDEEACQETGEIKQKTFRVNYFEYRYLRKGFIYVLDLSNRALSLGNLSLVYFQSSFV